MKRKLHCFAGFIIMVSLIQATDAQWVRTNGPEGGCILSLVMNDSIVIAGTDLGGVFRSTDRGETWYAAGLGNATIDCLCMHGGTILAGGNFSRLFRSTDNGITWSTIDSMMNIYSLATEGDTFYAGLSTQVHRSTDGGITWTKCAPFTESAHGLITALDAFGTTVFARTTLGCFMSTDNGATWSSSQSGNYFSKKAGMVAAALTGNEIRREWFGTHLPNVDIHSLFISGNRMIVVTENALIVSLADDTVWSTFSRKLENGLVNALAADGGMVIAGTNTGGIVRSTDNCATWRPSNTGLTNTGASTLAATGGTVFAAYNFSTYKGIYCSTDKGAHWTSVESGVSKQKIRTFMTHEDRIYAGTDRGIYLSTDGGKVWTESNSGLGLFDVRSMAAGGNWLFAGTNTGGLYYSTNRGARWDKLDSGFRDSCVLSLAVCDNRVYACTNHSGVRFSDDNGTSWAVVNTGLPVDAVNAFAVAGTTVVAGTPYGIFRKGNDDTQWQAVNADIDTSSSRLVTVNAFAISGNTLFAAIFNRGVYMSTDNGATWNDAGLGLLTKYVSSLAECEGTLFLGTVGCGIWKRPIAEMTGIRSGRERLNSPQTLKTTTFSMHGSGLPVTVTFTLSQSHIVTCSVYSLSGRRIATLVNGTFSPGEHSLSWNPQKCANGCYVVKTRTGSVSSEKMVTVSR